MDDPAPVTPPPITVLLVDDHEVVRRGVADLLSGAPGFHVVAAVETPEEALAALAEHSPQVAVLDVRLRDASGVDLCREIRSRAPKTRCMMLTSHDDDEAIFAAVMAGAAGYLLKEIRGAALVAAIREVAAGRSLLDARVTEQLLARLRDPGSGDKRLASLSTREREILGLIADGLTNRQISERLFLAEKTVKNNVSLLLDKLGLERRTQAAVFGDQLRRQ